jgi:hypothetical protein
MSALLPSLALLLGLTAVPPAVASDEASVTGSWTVDGQRLELRHARVFREADPFGKGTNPCVLVCAANRLAPREPPRELAPRD